MTFSNFTKTVFCRVYQAAASIPGKIIPAKEDVMLKGSGSLGKLPVYLKNRNINNVLAVIDGAVIKSGHTDQFFSKMNELGISYRVVAVNEKANLRTAEKCAKEYADNSCQAIAAVGGGAIIDCAKLAALMTKKSKRETKPDGRKILLRRMPYIFAVPSTAGSGSEHSSYAVCYDKKQKKNSIVSASALRPTATVLDPKLIETLPSDILAGTAMASLCRGVEAYIAADASKGDKENAKTAVRLIFRNTMRAYSEKDSDAMAELQKASYLSGVRAGYAHHGALSVGAVCRVPYSCAAAALLPAILRAYGEKAYRKLAELAESVNIQGETEKEMAEGFIKAIEKLNGKLSLSLSLREFKKNSIPKCAKTIAERCNPYYAAPKQLFYEDICNVLQKIKG